ncbi:hypothetical protein LINPERPRIM_LOCUS15350 [Linum perenne]
MDQRFRFGVISGYEMMLISQLRQRKMMS